MEESYQPLILLGKMSCLPGSLTSYASHRAVVSCIFGAAGVVDGDKKVTELPFPVRLPVPVPLAFFFRTGFWQNRAERPSTS
jgi:hypothetical protein